MTRERAIDVLEDYGRFETFGDKNYSDAFAVAVEALKQPEILTYEEQCIFLAAMGREIRLCEKIDTENDLPRKNSLTFICKEIMRKVKSTLWG